MIDLGVKWVLRGLITYCNCVLMDITGHIEKNGLSRAKICADAGISQPYLSMIERGKRKVGSEKVVSLAKALGVSTKDLRPDLAAAFS